MSDTRRPIVVTWLAVTLGLIAPHVGAAQTGSSGAMANQQPLTISGRINSVDAVQNMLTIRTLHGEERFSLDPAATITAGQRPIKLEELQPGADVTVRYTEKDGAQIAQAIDVRNAGAPSQAAPSRSPVQTPASQQR